MKTNGEVHLYYAKEFVSDFSHVWFYCSCHIYGCKVFGALAVVSSDSNINPEEDNRKKMRINASSYTAWMTARLPALPARIIIKRKIVVVAMPVLWL